MSAGLFTLGLWSGELSCGTKSPEDFAGRIGRVLHKARGAGCDMVMLHEYISAHLVRHKPEGIPATRELEWYAATGREILPLLQGHVRETGVALQAGSMPWKDGKKGIVNRAWTLFPDRAAVHHDKLVLIPSESMPKGWKIETGGSLRVFRWRGFRMAVLTCLDVEMAPLSLLLAKNDVDLVLVPSYTEKKSGYHRVFTCARARAVETMAAVAAVGCTGRFMRNGKIEVMSHGGAAVYVPSETRFGSDGIFAELPGRAKQRGEGKLLVAKDIPLGEIRKCRKSGAEVWPGPWDGRGVRVLAE